MSTPTGSHPAQGRAPFTAGQIAAMLGAELDGRADTPVTGVSSIDPGEPGALTFIRAAKFARKWGASKCSAALVSQGIDVEGHDPETKALILVPDADMAVIAILGQLTPAPHAPPAGVHPSAMVDETAQVADDATVGPQCVVGPGAVIGAGATLIARVSVGANASIGGQTLVHPGAVIADRCVVGANCVLHPNCVVGSDGFGFHRPGEDADHIRVPHAGAVVIEDDVEIGAGSCVDRSKFGATRIKRGAKLDNLVQIGHGCTIGERALICAQVGLAGSVTVGDDTVIAGQAGVADNFEIGAGAIIGAQSGVMSDVPARETYVGYPARKRSITLQIWGAQTRMHKFFRAQLARNKKHDEPDA